MFESKVENYSSVGQYDIPKKWPRVVPAQWLDGLIQTYVGVHHKVCEYDKQHMKQPYGARPTYRHGVGES